MAQHDNFVLLAAGGTGGHLFPAQALATELAGQDIETVLMTDQRGAGFKGKMSDIPVVRIASASLAGNLGRKLLAVGQLLRGVAQAHRYLRCHRPAVIVGFGGYPSVPVLCAARLLKIPYILHEQNALLGKANRLMASKSAIIATSFEHTARLPEKYQGQIMVTGNPVRAEIAAKRGRVYQAPDGNQGMRLLVMGGSQGARIFSKILPDVLAQLPEKLRQQIQIVQQCRPEDLEAVRQSYQDLKIPATLSSFFDNVAELMAASHLLISRSGASTLTEASMIGCPALFAPYPYAADDHQAYNAQAFVAGEAGWMARDADFTVEKIVELIEKISNDKTILTEAAQNAYKMGKPDATSALAQLVFPFIEQSSDHASG